MHRSGLERPHFVATEAVAVAPDHKLNRGFVRGVFCWGMPRDSGGAALERGFRTFVRQHVTQNRKGGAKRKHGNHQGTTQTTKISTPSYVIAEALKVLFKRDDEFKAWLGQHANGQNQEQIHGGAPTKTA